MVSPSGVHGGLGERPGTRPRPGPLAWRGSTADRWRGRGGAGWVQGRQMAPPRADPRPPPRKRAGALGSAHLEGPRARRAARVAREVTRRAATAGARGCPDARGRGEVGTARAGAAVSRHLRGGGPEASAHARPGLLGTRAGRGGCGRAARTRAGVRVTGRSGPAPAFLPRASRPVSPPPVTAPAAAGLQAAPPAWGCARRPGELAAPPTPTPGPAARTGGGAVV